MEDKLLDIDRVIYLFKKKLWLLILIVVVATGLGVYKASLMKISYESVAKIFISKISSEKQAQQDEKKTVNYYPQFQLAYYTEFMNTFSEIIKLDDFLSETLDKHNIDKEPWQVKSGISFIASESAPIYTVSYRTGSKEEAEKIVTAICEEFTNQIKASLEETDAKIIDTAKTHSIMPNRRRVVEIYFGVGLVLSIGVILLWDYLDDTVKNKDRLEKILHVPVLGEIPRHERGFKEDKF